MKNLFVLIDSNALIHRSFHAIPSLSTPDGTPINAVYGFTMTLLSAIKQLQPMYIAAAYDLPKPTFRHQLYKEYKAHREKSAEELISQIPVTKEILTALNIPIFAQEGIEADDVIGILSQQIKKNQIPVMIVTGDMDSLQLVDDLVKVYTLKRGLKDTVIYNPKTVKQRYGFPPQYLVDYKALRGDPSDNIPGVPGIGEKTATTIIKKYHTIEKLYDHITKNPQTNEIKPRIVELLIKNKDQAFLSKHLATILLKPEISDFKIQDCLVQDYNQKKAIQLFQKFGFKSLIPRLPQPIQPTQENLFDSPIFKTEKPKISSRSLPIGHDTILKNIPGKHYQTINTLEKLQKILPKLENGFTFDTETSALDLYDQTKLVGISIAIKPNHAYYLPLNHQINSQNSTEQNLPKNSVELIKTFFTNPDIPKNGHNLKFDIQALELENIHVQGIVFDTMIASYLLNPSLPGTHNLDHLAFTHLQHQMIPIEQLIGKGEHQISFADISIKNATIYSCEDADISLILRQKFSDLIRKNQLDQVLEKIEIPLISILAQMEQNGFLLDHRYLEIFNQKIIKNIQKLETEIYQSAGKKFNIASTQQLSQVLFDVLEISRANIKKTKTGISTAASELEKMKNTHPIIPLIQEYRLLAKLQNTYISTLPNLVKSDQRIHTSFNQTITATGRLSSSNPNLQNIPIKTDLGRDIRQAFVAPPDHTLIAADYSQIELRLMSHIAKEPTMIKAFQQGQDIHASTASLIYHCPLKNVTSSQRYNAKTINFSIIYGAGPRNIANQLNISFNEAKEFIDQYFANFPLIKIYMDQAIQFAQKNGFVKTLYGRRRLLPEINSHTPQIRAQAERIAINMPIQGTAADIMKLAMIKTHQTIKKHNLPIKILSQVHDELIFEVPEYIVKKTTNIIRQCMEQVCSLKVPLMIDIEVGHNWGQMEKID